MFYLDFLKNSTFIIFLFFKKWNITHLPHNLKYLQQDNMTNMFQPEAGTNSSEGRGYLQLTKTWVRHVCKHF